MEWEEAGKLQVLFNRILDKKSGKIIAIYLGIMTERAESAATSKVGVCKGLITIYCKLELIILSTNYEQKYTKSVTTLSHCVKQYTKSKEIEDLSLGKYKKKRADITYADLIKKGLTQCKKTDSRLQNQSV